MLLFSFFYFRQIRFWRTILVRLHFQVKIKMEILLLSKDTTEVTHVLVETVCTLRSNLVDELWAS